ncbi:MULTISPECIES: DUF3793 family protein [unclassified Clostridium]|uniref:DUF3793 family protein n=1 Tax=Clostridium TaxID=1485 RepID=UPI001C8B4F90|nr:MULTISPECIES: DUF3793 family protein [unclassified Clostridium]MBX9138227.1 DUF3793 family protein [Clostridium sp. K12(2020)]MBX9144575.1 DUF3793 family protein [Clostridium sp. K13]MDU2289006.1 DUF3793 family protein [Clostridium celatum]
MKQIEFYKSLSKMEERECIEKFLIYNASLVISGVKPSATITIKKGNENLYDKWIKYGISFLKEIDIQYINLRECSNALIILIYSEEKLSNYIFKEENKRFLRQLGYSEENDMREYLEILKRRYKEFNCPHELGIFLGFPLNDVKDFMNCKDKKCLSCGYWLVYNNLQEAQEIFSKYDKVKAHTVNYILSGDSSQEVAYSIRSLFENYKSVTA